MTSWNVHQLPVPDAFWGPVTASIDWCEANYDVSIWIAEFMNTISNIPFLAMAVFGLYTSHKNRLPSDLLLPYVGLSLIGLGSFFFHLTLSYHTQLLDELPMLFGATFVTYCVFNTQRAGEKAAVPGVGYILFAIVSTVTVAYLIYPNPVLHQAAFASILLSCVARATYLCYNHLLDTPFEQQRNREVIKTQTQGAAFIIGAFAIWLVDCFACTPLTRAKLTVGKPLAFLLELHAWWHLGTGAAGYWLAVSLQLLVLSLRGDPHYYALSYTLFGLLPYVRRRTGEEKVLLSEKKAPQDGKGMLHAVGAIRADDEGYAANGHASVANGFQHKCKSQ